MIVEEQQNWSATHLVRAQLAVARLFGEPERRESKADARYRTNEDLWGDLISESLPGERTVRLEGFNLFEWIPRSPGLFHTRRGRESRDLASHHLLDRPWDQRGEDCTRAFRKATGADSARTRIFNVRGKNAMLEGGVGCVRLRSVHRGDDQAFWFMSASSSDAPDEGVIVLISDDLYQSIIRPVRSKGFVSCDLIGRTRFLADDITGILNMPTQVPSLYIEVENIQERSPCIEAAQVSVSTSFVSDFNGNHQIYASYVTFDPGAGVDARHEAVRWMEDVYVRQLHDGQVLTDFDQQATVRGRVGLGLERIVTDPGLCKRIADLMTTYGRFKWSMIDEASVVVENIGVKYLTTNTNTGSGNLFYAGRDIRDVNIGVSRSFDAVDLEELAATFVKLKAALADEPDTSARDLLRGQVGAVAEAAQSGDREKTKDALQVLKPAWGKVSDLIEKVFVGVAVGTSVAALKTFMGGAA